MDKQNAADRIAELVEDGMHEAPSDEDLEELRGLFFELEETRREERRKGTKDMDREMLRKELGKTIHEMVLGLSADPLIDPVVDELMIHIDRYEVPRSKEDLRVATLAGVYAEREGATKRKQRVEERQRKQGDKVLAENLAKEKWRENEEGNWVKESIDGTRLWARYGKLGWQGGYTTKKEREGLGKSMPMESNNYWDNPQPACDDAEKLYEELLSYRAGKRGEPKNTEEGRVAADEGGRENAQGSEDQDPRSGEPGAGCYCLRVAHVVDRCPFVSRDDCFVSCESCVLRTHTIAPRAQCPVCGLWYLGRAGHVCAYPTDRMVEKNTVGLDSAGLPTCPPRGWAKAPAPGAAPRGGGDDGAEPRVVECRHIRENEEARTKTAKAPTLKGFEAIQQGSADASIGH